MYVVMVEFDVDPNTTDAVLAAVEGLLMDLVRHQEGFVAARLHRQFEGPKVVNYMHWTSKDAFDAFRAVHKDKVGAAVGAYGPQFNFYEVAREVSSPN